MTTFHLLSLPEYLAVKGKSGRWLARHYSAPEWCCDPDVFTGKPGCQKLLSRRVSGESDCSKCMYLKRPMPVSEQVREMLDETPF